MTELQKAEYDILLRASGTGPILSRYRYERLQALEAKLAKHLRSQKKEFEG